MDAKSKSKIVAAVRARAAAAAAPVAAAPATTAPATTADKAVMLARLVKLAEVLAQVAREEIGGEHPIDRLRASARRAKDVDFFAREIAQLSTEIVQAEVSAGMAMMRLWR